MDEMEEEEDSPLISLVPNLDDKSPSQPDEHPTQNKKELEQQ